MTVTVLHLAGSAVSDFHADLSRTYARDCLEATADPARETHVAYVTPDRLWRFPTDLGRAAIDTAVPMGPADAVREIAARGVEVMVPQMFCLPGMTHYRALFDLLGVPYAGNAPDVMALTAHKARARAVVAGAGVAVPRGEVLRAGDRPTLAPPVVIKPVDADNSLGVSLVRDAGGFAPALRTAFAHSDAVLVEEYVELGREVRCGVVVRGGRLVVLPLEEYAMDRDSKPIRGYGDKLDRDADGEVRLVAKDPTRSWSVDPADPVTAAVADLARRSHTALGCRDYSLFDVRIDPAGKPWFLEAGLYCSFARTSVIPTMAAAAGIPLRELFRTALDTARAPEPVRLGRED